MSKKIDKELIKAVRRTERLDRAANDPWFGKRRKTFMEGDGRKIASKNACRGKVRDW